jgi:hypothetical protein
MGARSFVLPLARISATRLAAFYYGRILPRSWATRLPTKTHATKQPARRFFVPRFLRWAGNKRTFEIGSLMTALGYLFCPGPVGALKRPYRSPQHCQFAWRFCLGAQGA